jgi:hypothetical protein
LLAEGAMIRDFDISRETGRRRAISAKIFEPAFGNYPLVPIFAVLFEERRGKVLKNSIKRSITCLE